MKPCVQICLTVVKLEKVTVNVGDITEVELWRLDEKLSFVITEEDFKQPLDSENLADWIFSHNFIMNFSPQRSSLIMAFKDSNNDLHLL